MTFEYFLASICHSDHFDVEITMELKVAYICNLYFKKVYKEGLDS